MNNYCFFTLFFYFTIAVWQCPTVTLEDLGGTNCYTPAKQLMSKNEGCVKCVYYDTSKKPKRTIGIGFCIDCDLERARENLEAVGANYDAIINAKPLKSPYETCDCSDPQTCLTAIQISKLFDITAAPFLSYADKIVPADICCGVYAVVADLAYNTGNKVTTNWPQLIQFISQHSWQAASNCMKSCHPNWCSQVPDRCKTNVAQLAAGCTCAGKSCGTAACYDPNHDGPCCNLQMDCTDPSAHGTITATVVCPNGYPNCCPIGCCPTGYPNCCTNGCCPTDYPICCPNDRCCPSNYPVCCSNFCCASNTACCGNSCCTSDMIHTLGIPKQSTFQ